MKPTRVPTPAECSTHAGFDQTPEGWTWFAIWFPQVGGSGTPAAVCIIPNDGCFELAIYTDGEFPTDKDPIRWHCCDAAQFVRFGNAVAEMISPASQRKPMPTVPDDEMPKVLRIERCGMADDTFCKCSEPFGAEYVRVDTADFGDPPGDEDHEG